MKQDRLSIHISDNAEITVEERVNGVKRVKMIALNDLLICIRSSLKEVIPKFNITLPKNALFYSCAPESNEYSAALEYPYYRANITYMNTEYSDFPLPRLVFGFKVENSGRLSRVMLGVTENGILRESSKMYIYPFSNVSKSNFSVCTGQNSLPDIKQPYSLTNMPDYILSLPDNDDHFSSSHNKLNLGHRELMEHLRDKSPEYYYTDVLIPSGKTLKDFYEECAL